MMKRSFVVGIVCLISFAIYAQEMVDDATPAGTLPQNDHIDGKWELDFSDEFNAAIINTEKWTVNNSAKSRAARPNIGISYWYWKPENVWQEDGDLILQVKKHNSNTMYCGGAYTYEKYHTTYGYFEARIKIADAAKGTHTAFWLQGPNMGNVDGAANDGAEIDVFESAWLGDYTKSVVHIDGYGASHQANTKQYSTPGLHEGYHTWGLHWTEDFMKIYYDGELKVSYSDPKWVVQVDEFLWLSDGASFGLTGDYFTSQAVGVLTRAEVDYIRVWKDTSSTSTVVGNLIENGDFERASTSFWAESNSDILISENVYPVAGGSAYCRMPGVPNGRDIRQTVGVEPGAKYVFGFSGRIQNSHAASDDNNHATNGPATLKGEVWSASDLLLGLSTQSRENISTSDTVQIPAGVNSVVVKISKNWNVGYVDNVVLEKVVTTGVEEERHIVTELHIYPNPAQSQIRIKSDHPIRSYRILNCHGSVLESYKQVNDYSIELGLERYVSGVYILQLILENGGIESELFVKE